MSFIDIILGIPILIYAFKGFSKGFIRTLTSFAGLVLAIIGTIHFSDVTATILKDYLYFNSKFMPIIAFIVTFFVIFFTINIIGLTIKKVIHSIHLGCIDKILGLALGVLTIVFILSIIVNAFDYLNNKFPIVSDNTKEESLLYHPLNNIAIEFYDWFDFNLFEWGEEIMKKTKKLKENII